MFDVDPTTPKVHEVHYCLKAGGCVAARNSTAFLRAVFVGAVRRLWEDGGKILVWRTFGVRVHVYPIPLNIFEIVHPQASPILLSSERHQQLKLYTLIKQDLNSVKP